MKLSKKASLFLLCALIASTAVAGPDFVLLKEARKNQLMREQQSQQVKPAPKAESMSTDAKSAAK